MPLRQKIRETSITAVKDKILHELLSDMTPI